MAAVFSCQDIVPMKRILLIGCAGAGKSVLAAKIAARLSLPCIHLDRVFWKAGWVEPDRNDFDRRLLKILKTKKWVMDGNYGRTQELRQRYADTVILLDFSRWICLWRVLGRIVKDYGRSRPDLADGCYEQFDWKFLQWIWNYPRQSRPEIVEKIKHLKKNQKAVILRHPKEAERFLNTL
jgi:adenylate kinase family enzyme